MLMTITGTRPILPMQTEIHLQRRVAQLYADLRNWQTANDYIPSPIVKTDGRTTEAPSGGQPQRQTVVMVKLLDEWWDTEKYFKFERRLVKEQRGMLVLIRTAQKTGRPLNGKPSMPMSYGVLLDNKFLNEQDFYWIQTALESIIHALDK